MTLPRLWCPLLTHYDHSGAIDFDRMRAHLARLRPHVDAFLMPGSTSDGWQLSEEETDAVIGFGLEQENITLLIGALRPTVAGMQAVIERTSSQRIAGFTVCAPHGDLSQEAIEAGLAEILAMGRPTALYQLPQITKNRLAPETVARLSDRFPSLFLFKDSSGEDTVALSGQVPERVFLVRGAEGDYARWLQPAGPYHGFLLSTANCFPSELRAIVDAPDSPESQALSARVSQVVATVFAAVADVPVGNAFTNANKALDHVFAHGPEALSVPPPVLHGGSRLPAPAIAAAHDALRRAELLPAVGYL